MSKIRHIALLATSVVGLAGCQAYWDPQPDFGTYVNGAVQAQIQNPKAPKGYPKSVVGMDGPSANSSVESYQKTFERKQTQQTQTSTGSIVGGSGLSVQ